MFYIWLLLIILLLKYLYYIIKKKQSFWQEKGIAFLKPKFLKGNSIFLRKTPIPNLLLNEYKQFPNDRYYGNYNFIEPLFVIKDPELIKEITIRSFDHFMNHRTFANYEIDKFWGRNLLSSSGNRWKNMRSSLSPSFTASKMRLMFGLMDECAKQFINYYKKDSNKIIELNVKDSFNKYTSDVIGSTAFGIEVNSFKQPYNKFLLAGEEAANFGSVARILRILVFAFSPKLAKLLKIKIIPNKLEKYFTEVIGDVLKFRKENNIYRPDMLQQLLNAQENHEELQLTIDDINSHAFFFFLAGSETVSAFLTFTLYELVLNPNIQKRLRNEIQLVNGKITYEELMKLKYLDMVLSETLRKWPPAPFAERIVTKDFVIEPIEKHEKRFVLEKGIDCMIPIFSIHRDSKYYPNPDKFDPERFNEENKSNIKSGTYLPFGLGPRSCIGYRYSMMEAKLMIFYILRNFEVVAIEKTQIPIQLASIQLTLTVKNGLWLGFKPLHEINNNKNNNI